MSDTDATQEDALELSPADRARANQEAADARAEQEKLRKDREKAAHAAERETERARKDAEQAEREREKADRQRVKATQTAQKEEERRRAELLRSLREADKEAGQAQREAEKAELDAALARQRAERAVDKARRRAAIVEPDDAGTPGTSSAAAALRLPSDVAILWRAVEPARHGPRPGMSLDRIAEAGIALADADGLGAVSMARVAESLGFTTMSLYRYVSSKDDVVALMTDAAIGSPPDHPDLAGAPWREAAERWVLDRGSVVGLHPWLAQTSAAVHALGPNQLRWADRIVAAFEGTALTPGEKVETGRLLGAHLLNQVRTADGITVSADSAANRSLTDGTSVVNDYVTLMAALADPVTHPALHAAANTGKPGPTGNADPQATAGDATSPPTADVWPLDFGVCRILDGIGVLIARRA